MTRPRSAQENRQCPVIEIANTLTTDLHIEVRCMTSKVTRPGPMHSRPLPGFPQHLEQLPFLTFCIRAELTAVLPTCSLRQAHQDTLNARAGRHQAEFGAAVVHEVKLNIAAAAKELPAALLVRALHIRAAAEDGEIRGEECVPGGAHKCEDSVGGPRTVGEARVREALVGCVAEVVEEEPADAAGLAAVRDEEVLVAPRLEAWVQRGAVCVARRLERRVEVLRVIGVEVRRGEVRAAAEPPRQHFARLGGVRHLEVAIVDVNGRRVRVAWVDDEREARGEEGEALLTVGVVRQGPVVGAHLLDCGGGEQTVYDGDIDASLFEDRGCRSRREGNREHGGDAVATFGTIPAIAEERRCIRVELLEGGDDGVLETLDIVSKSIAH